MVDTLRVTNFFIMKRKAAQPSLADRIVLQLKLPRHQLFFLFGINQRDLRKSLGLSMPAIIPKVKISVDEVSEKMEEWLNHSYSWRFDFSYADMLKYTGLRREQAHSYFSRMGTDFRLWINAHRMEEAKKRLLEDRSLKIDEISKDLGFKDKSNFHRQFRLTVGVTPKQWRENNGFLET